jgi:hypothetical protein
LIDRLSPFHYASIIVFDYACFRHYYATRLARLSRRLRLRHAATIASRQSRRIGHTPRDAIAD